MVSGPAWSGEEGCNSKQKCCCFSDFSKHSVEDRTSGSHTGAEFMTLGANAKASIPHLVLFKSSHYIGCWYWRENATNFTNLWGLEFFLLIELIYCISGWAKIIWKWHLQTKHQLYTTHKPTFSWTDQGSWKVTLMSDFMKSYFKTPNKAKQSGSLTHVLLIFSLLSSVWQSTVELGSPGCSHCSLFISVE